MNEYEELKKTIEESGLFDKLFYVKTYPDVLKSDMKPIDHFVQFGLTEDRKPNVDFDAVWYKEYYVDIKENGINPFVHFITYGKDENRFQNEAEKEEYEKLQNEISDVNLETTNEKHEYSDEISLIKKSGLFKLDWYEMKYPDMKNQDAILHYCIFGYKEGRNPNPFFDTNWYKLQYPEVKDRNPLVHYVTTGWKKGYNPSYKFDSKKYLEMYIENKSLNISPLGHFLTIGIERNYKIFNAETEQSISIDKESSFSKKLFPDLSELFDYEPISLQPKTKYYNAKSLNIHFVIPDFGVGGGGHMNIFRQIKFLEFFGHTFTIWIFRPSFHKTAEDAYDDIIRHYSTIKSKVKFIDDDFKNAEGDVIIASSWDTVWPVQSAKYFKRRFYFIQDYETLFNAKGSRSELAELTYSQDIDCICASPWLDKLMKTKFNRWSDYFNLAAEKTTFFPTKKVKNKIPRIAFYARIFTERRAVELGILALEMLAKEGFEFHVDFYGATFTMDKVPFSCNIYNKKTPEELAEIYNKSDLGVVFSLTNYSLVPQEMMACGLPIIEFDTESTRAIYPNDVVTFCGPNPLDIKNKIRKLLIDTNKRELQSQKALEWVNQFSWQKSARKIESILLNRLLELGFVPRETKKEDKFKASIVIPTYNGGNLFKQVLEAIKKQNTPWEYEIIILDSESKDGTAEYVQAEKNIIYKKILKKDFNHGMTRNFGASIANGEFVVFITQDAIPLNNEWLYNMVTILEHYPNAAGAFGKHVPHDDASYFTKKELNDHFENFSNFPLSISKETKIPEGLNEEAWKNVLHFYSDNNSCLRKEVWKQVPYRDLQYGEDQVWADDIIKAGYEKVYALTSSVKHSHEYTPNDVYERSKIDGDYFKFFWNYKLVDENSLDYIIEEFEKNAKITALENGISKTELDRYIASIRNRLQGYVDGYNKPISMFHEASAEKSKF